MKMRNISIVLICLAVALSLQFLSCDIFTPVLPDNTADVTISFSTGAGRAALSPDSMNFTMYNFTFLKDGLGEKPFNKKIPASEAQGGVFTFQLEKDQPYQLTVEAFVGDVEPRIKAAEGKLDWFTVTTGLKKTVNLQGFSTSGGTGTFSWNITYPNTTVLQELILYRDDQTTVDLGTLSDTPSAGKRTTSGEKSGIPSGRYFFIARLGKPNGDVAGYANGVEIFPGQTTYFGKPNTPYEFTDTFFSDPNRINVGEEVFSWNGFYVRGDCYMPANPKATLYRNTNNLKPGMGSYKNVLKLEPSSAYATNDSMAMTYKWPISTVDDFTTYPGIGQTVYFSVFVWLEQIAGTAKAPNVAFYDNKNRCPVASRTNVPTGSWQKIETSVALKGSDGAFHRMTQGYLFGLETCGNVVANNALANYNIYMRDPYLRVINENYETVVLIGENTSGSFVISPSYSRMYNGDSKQLTLTGDITGGNPNWVSSNPAVATVDKRKGIVTAIAPGYTTITVSSGTQTSAPVRVDVHQKYIALTFDDGPDPGPNKDGTVTQKLLTYLANAPGGAVKGTFFMEGVNAQANPAIVRAIYLAGHELGNHSMDHDYDFFNSSSTSKANFITNLMDAQKAIQNAAMNITNGTGSGTGAPKLIRTPNFSQQNNLILAARDLFGSTNNGLPVIFGELLNDWVMSMTVEDIVKEALKCAKPWSFLIFHDTYDRGLGGELYGNGLNTVEAVPIVIAELRKQGYKFMTISELATARGGITPLTSGVKYYDFSDNKW